MMRCLKPCDERLHFGPGFQTDIGTELVQQALRYVGISHDALVGYFIGMNEHDFGIRRRE